MSQLSRQIKQGSPFASREEETYLNLQRTSSSLFQGLNQVLKEQGLSPGQYNVLRILRGAHPEALTCGEIAERLVTPGPDVTRLLDRLCIRGAAARHRDENDRRIVRSFITEDGLEALKALDEPIKTWLEDRLGHLSPADHKTLVRLLEAVRQPFE